MDDRLFRDAMGKFATGITVVTIMDGDTPIGMTVNAFMSISLHPKLIAVSIDESASMYDKLINTDKFGVSILSENQKDYSMVFARQKKEKEDINFVYSDGVPVLTDALATLSCNVKERVPAGDHLIYIAEVTDITMNEGSPIIFYGGKYHELNK